MAELQFLYIKAAEKVYQEFPWHLKIGPGKEERRFRYLQRKLPLLTEPLTVAGKEGLQVTLPFQLQEMKCQDAEWRFQLLERIAEEQQAENMAMPRKEMALFPAERLCDGKRLPLLFLENILFYLIESRRLVKKETCMVLFAGEPVSTCFLLKQLGSQYNYLTLVVEERTGQEEWEVVLEQLYEEYGLAVSVQTIQPGVFIEGDIFIDLAGLIKKCHRNLSEGGLVLDILQKNDLRYLQNRRDDLELYYSFAFGVETVVPGPLLEAAFCRQDTWLSEENMELCCLELKEAGLKLLKLNGREIE